MKVRLNVYLEPKTGKALADVAAVRQLSKSAIVEAAVVSFLTPDHADALEAALARRLDQLGRELERLRKDQATTLEALGLFVRAWLTATPPLAEDAQAAAQEKGLERYESFAEVLGKRMQSGQGLAESIRAR